MTIMFNHSWLKNVKRASKMIKSTQPAICWVREDGEKNNGNSMLNFHWNKLLKNRSNLTTNLTLLWWEEEHTPVSTKGSLSF